jgi:hypothetical protein
MSDDPLTSNGISDVIWLYVIHNDDEIIFIIENTNEYGFVDFLVYNKYIKINLPDTEIKVAEYAIINSFDIIIEYRYYGFRLFCILPTTCKFNRFYECGIF